MSFMVVSRVKIVIARVRREARGRWMENFARRGIFLKSSTILDRSPDPVLVWFQFCDNRNAIQRNGFVGVVLGLYQGLFRINLDAEIRFEINLDEAKSISDCLKLMWIRLKEFEIV